MEKEVQILREQLPTADIQACLGKIEKDLEAGNLEAAQDGYEITGLQFDQWQGLGVSHEEGEMKVLFAQYQSLASRISH